MHLHCSSSTAFLVTGLLVAAPCHGATPAPGANNSELTVFDAKLSQRGQKTPELSTNEFKAFLAKKEGIVLDARAQREFDVAHVPGSICIEEAGFLRLVQKFSDRHTEIVIYSNGPYSDNAGRRADDLVRLGYRRVGRYQLGLQVWRALGNTAESTLEGLRRMFSENSAVMIDARRRAEYLAGTIPGAESVREGEVSAALHDHRLQYYDHNTRMVVFGGSAGEARLVAEELARHAFPNSSYFGGSYLELKRAKFFSEKKPSSPTGFRLTH